eukprot:TRINITY_DN19109_c0_g1_i1.p1 TRINITY_DN19109_c0_g1~~TRINITY_DN19109_c0_g1_i1.p1  ORF type:complete len:289 (-),score=58.25 TRINITY_DN19109_c0_g1_i1:1767-2633(-)
MGPGNDVAVSFDSGPMLSQVQHRRGGPLVTPMQPMLPQMRPAVPVPLGAPGMGMGPVYGPGGGPGSGPGGPGMAFMSFPLGDTASNFNPPPRMASGMSMSGVGFGANAFEDEPPLLEELGINIPQILRKMVSVLHPFRVNVELHEEGDLSGPLMFCMLFGFCQLLAGKVYFGIILGWTSLACVFVYGVFNLLVSPLGGQAGGSSLSLDLYRCCSIVGYSLLPLILCSALSLFVPRGVKFIVGALAVVWSSRTSSRLLVSVVPHADEYRYLLAYPCALVYAALSLLILF